jgi:hypothetical protein
LDEGIVDEMHATRDLFKESSDGLVVVGHRLYGIIMISRWRENHEGMYVCQIKTSVYHRDRDLERGAFEERF